MDSGVILRGSRKTAGEGMWGIPPHGGSNGNAMLPEHQPITEQHISDQGSGTGLGYSPGAPDAPTANRTALQGQDGGARQSGVCQDQRGKEVG